MFKSKRENKKGERENIKAGPSTTSHQHSSTTGTQVIATTLQEKVLFTTELLHDCPVVLPAVVKDFSPVDKKLFGLRYNLLD